MWYFVFSEILSPVGNVEAGQVVGSIAEEVQQGVARLRHHLRDGLVPISLRNNQTATIITQKKSLRCFITIYTQVCSKPVTYLKLYLKAARRGA